MTSTQIIVGLPMQLDLSIREINALCRKGELYAYKIKNEAFEPWIIPEDSFALYLKYHPLLLQDFIELDMSYDKGSEYTMFVNKVMSCLTKSYRDETYTLKQLSYIFDKPENQISAWFDISKFMYLVVGRRINVPALEVVQHLSANPTRLEVLKERHKFLLAKGDPAESAVRHLLMLQAYYAANGHLN